MSNLPFQISGNKQWLPPLSLDMGIALLFEIDESCKEAHMWDRRPWGRDGAQNEIEAAENLDKSRSDENHLEETSAQLESDEEFHGNADETIPSDQAHSLEAQNGNNLNLIEHIDRSIDESPHETGHPVEDQIENEVYSSDPTDNRDVVETTADLYADITAKRLPQIFDTPSRKSSSESIPRGRRAKSKKNSKKYAEQDEEDRLLMMQLLGSQKGPQPKGKKEKAAFAKKQELEAKKIKEDERRRNSQKASDSAPRTANNDDRKFGEKVIPTDVDMNLLAIDRFIGNPNAGDILLHVIPVCAPWMTLKKYKYKIKLVPGAMKRGKAAKSATSIFSTMATEAEQADSPVPDLIKAVPEPEWIMAMLPKVKVVGSDQKRGKK